MAKILLFGSSTIFGVPNEVLSWLEQYVAQGHEFIVGDCKGSEAAFHKALSSVGADKVTIYSMGAPRNNNFRFPSKQFDTHYNEDTKQATLTCEGQQVYTIAGVEKEMDIPYTREWYEFKDKQMIQDCHMAIGLYDGKSKGTLHMIQLLGIYNKPCYTFTIEV